MVDGDRRDHAGKRMTDHIGGIEPAAETHFQQQHVGGMARKQQQTGGGGDLEDGDGRPGIGLFAFFQCRRELVVRNERFRLATNGEE